MFCKSKNRLSSLTHLPNLVTKHILSYSISRRLKSLNELRLCRVRDTWVCIIWINIWPIRELISKYGILFLLSLMLSSGKQMHIQCILYSKKQIVRARCYIKSCKSSLWKSTWLDKTWHPFYSYQRSLDIITSIRKK